ncbi:MAG: FecR domain-containing protein [Deltaproteobacteria bacterium]|nr:FecR domain-containing protein [Deltaproteobacteria bacterium]
MQTIHAQFVANSRLALGNISSHYGAMILRITALAVFFVLAQVNTSAAARPAGAQNIGRVSAVEGSDGTGVMKVEIRGDAGTRRESAGGELRAGDHVLPGHELAVTLQLRDGSEIMLAPDSELSLDEVADRTAKGGSRLGLLRGLVHAIVNKIYTNEQPFMVSAGNCVMGVRGTEFVVDREDSGQSTLHTLTGSVAIARSAADLRASKAIRLVRAGSSSLMRPGLQLPRAPKKFNPKTLDDYLGGRASTVARVVLARRAARIAVKHAEEAKRRGPPKKKVTWKPPQPKRTKGK